MRCPYDPGESDDQVAIHAQRQEEPKLLRVAARERVLSRSHDRSPRCVGLQGYGSTLFLNNCNVALMFMPVVTFGPAATYFQPTISQSLHVPGRIMPELMIDPGRIRSMSAFTEINPAAVDCAGAVAEPSDGDMTSRHFDPR